MSKALKNKVKLNDTVSVKDFGAVGEGSNEYTAIATAGRITAASVATVKGAMPIYDEANVLYGYAPIYTSYA